jgi:hypothetical protein
MGSAAKTAQLEDVITAPLETTPGKDMHWSRALTPARAGLNKSIIGRSGRSSTSSRTCRTPSSCPPPVLRRKRRRSNGPYHDSPEKGSGAIMTERRGRKRLEPWMTAALATGEPALWSFVTGGCALTKTPSPTGSGSQSSGAVEGHVNRIKMLKRQV